MPASSLYLDTNLLVAIYIEEEASHRVTAWFEAQSAEFVVSDWTLVEFTSALGLKVRTGELSARQADDVQEKLEETLLPLLQVLAIDRSTYARAQMLMRSYALGLRAADALHLAMCVNEEARTLATADRVLYTAARRLKQSAVCLV